MQNILAEKHYRNEDLCGTYSRTRTDPNYGKKMEMDRPQIVEYTMRSIARQALKRHIRIGKV